MKEYRGYPLTSFLWVVVGCIAFSPHINEYPELKELCRNIFWVTFIHKIIKTLAFIYFYEKENER